MRFLLVGHDTGSSARFIVGGRPQLARGRSPLRNGPTAPPTDFAAKKYVSARAKLRFAHFRRGPLMPAPRPPPPPPVPPPPPAPALETKPVRAEHAETLRERLEREAEATADPVRRAVLYGSIAELVLGSERNDEAVLPLYEAAVEADPAYLPALDALYRIYRRRDDRPAVIRVAQARALAAPAGARRADALADLAEALEDLAGDPAGADDACEQAVREDPGCRVAWMALERRAAARGDLSALRWALEG